MRFLTFTIYAIIMTFSHTSEAQGLNDYQWKNRILLLVDKSSSSEALISQLEVLNADKKALKERDLIIFRITPDEVLTSNGEKTKIGQNEIYKNYNLESNFKGVILLGKDGGVKMRQPFEVKTQKIFALIDGMPMRKREIRESGED
ncbi:hypothetical protein LCGC14_1093240 [marine sediment metagenome]|uniref:DUF4174 domain-containing protein n=2 Tax=root TaxID=1 RepID=A0A831QSB5_9FLAO|nr:DUF4174 domain-containing protein [Pricia sp.]HEA21942.1 DUF4174 domain-containing protein [Pricia antarctica]